MTTVALICILSPFVGALTTPLLARVHERVRDTGAVLASLVSGVAALTLLPRLVHPDGLPVERSVRWLSAPLDIDVGILIDPLSIVMGNVVAVVSSIIMVYCLGYMRDEPARTRFWMWMNGFIGSMLLLVFSSNLLLLFVGWKLVGVCSYGLIGFYYQDQRQYWIGGPEPYPFASPSMASLKALVVTGSGDMLMLGGIFIIYAYAGTLNFLDLYASAPTWVAAMAAHPGIVVLASLLLLAGPLGKSAQFPFHEWLPEAMAGPGPVSALIHAATMVKSGVYLVARLIPIFSYAYWGAGVEAAAWFFHLTAWLGAFTAFLAATQGLVALELKKALAYSTVSQIGYMMLALGAAGLAPGLLLDGYTAGVFHLVSHALFKACLFLCAATTIHAVHSIYLHDMGAARRYLPLTWAFTLVAACSLMGLPPFPGFWSKDAVLLVVLDASPALLTLGLLTAALTAFYTIRFVGLVFHGDESAAFEHARESGGHVDDGTISMRLAAGLLAVAILAAGLAGPWLENLLHHAFESSVAGTIAAEVAASHAMEAVAPDETSSSHTLIPALSLVAVLLGAAPAYLLFIARRESPAAILARYPALAALRRFFWSRWGIDSAYTRVFVQGTDRVAAAVAGIEQHWNRAVHERLPRLFTSGTQRLVRHLRADTEELVYNVSYILVLFVLLLSLLFLGTSWSI